MTCDRCQSLIDDYVDGALDASERTQVEDHLVQCAACRAMADDFRAIRRAARDLEPHVPPAHAWTRVSEGFSRERQRRSDGRFAWAFGWKPLAAAAMLLLALGGTSWIVWRQTTSSAPHRAATATSPARGADAEIEQSVEVELKLAEEHYQRAIAGLEQITSAQRDTLDPQVAAVLQKNLDVIDQAIGESREALQTQPTNEVAQESLFQALRNKVSLLQDTVVLINEMRKGNQEGAARAISGLNQ